MSFEQTEENTTDVKTDGGSSTTSIENSGVNNNAAPSQAVDTPDVKSSDSSTDKDVKKDPEQSLKDLISKGIKDVTEGAKAKSDSSADEENTKEDKDKTDETEGAEKPEDDSDKIQASEDINKHPKVKAILRERKKARAERDEALKQVELYKKDAGQWQQIRNFLDTNRIPDSDAGEALKLAALWHKDPVQLFQRVQEIYMELGQRIGAILPQDLQEEVNQGLISQERAQQLASANGKTKLVADKAQYTENQLAQQNNQREYDFRVQLFNNWAEQTGKTDPDLQRKFPFILERVKYLLDTEGDPRSPQEAYDRLTRAHSEVSTRLKDFIPARPVTKPSPNPSAPGVSASPPPKTFDEAMKRALNGVFQNA